MTRARQIRLDRGLSATEVCRESGVTHKALRRLEDTGELGHATTLKNIADFYGVPASELLDPMDSLEQAA